MRNPSVGLALEGLPYIIISAFSTLVFAVLEWELLAVLSLGLTLFIGHVFRDPERMQPEDAELVVAPADGKVSGIARETDPVTGEERQVISIRMNPLDVPVNRMPVSGKMQTVRYIPGKIFTTAPAKDGSDNERCVLEIVGKGNQRFTLVQMADYVARRIVCHAEPGDKFKRGDRFGLIKFGSRVDLYLPDSYGPSVGVGDKVVAGETAIAEKR